MKPKKLLIQQEYLNYIKSGSKTVEGRIASTSLKAVNAGDTILFKCMDELVSCRVVQKYIYESFAEMLKDRGLQNCLPSVNDVNVGIEIYRSFPNYRELEVKCGVIAFEIELENRSAAAQ